MLLVWCIFITDETKTGLFKWIAVNSDSCTAKDTKLLMLCCSTPPATCVSTTSKQHRQTVKKPVGWLNLNLTPTWVAIFWRWIDHIHRCRYKVVLFWSLLFVLSVKNWTQQVWGINVSFQTKLKKFLLQIFRTGKDFKSILPSPRENCNVYLKEECLYTIVPSVHDCFQSKNSKLDSGGFHKNWDITHLNNIFLKK